MLPNTIDGFHITKHAKQRADEESITEDHIRVVLRYGKTYYGGRSLEIMLPNRSKQSKQERRARKKIPKRLKHLKLIIAPDSDTIVTLHH